MTSIANITVHTVGQYNEAGKTLVSAYRTGVQRLIDGAATRTNDFLANTQLPLVSEDIKAKLVGANEKVSGFLNSRLDIDTSRVVNLMDRVTTLQTNGIEAVADRAAKIEQPMVTSIMSLYSQLNMPVAKVSAQIADKVAQGAKQIEVRVAGNQAQAVVSNVKAKAAKPVRRAARKA